MQTVPELTQDLQLRLTSLRDTMQQLADRWLGKPRPIDPAYERSAANLLHYLALRQQDLRPIQQQLAQLGLSSLGRSESHVLASVEAVLNRLADLSGTAPSELADVHPDFVEGQRLLDEHTTALFGTPPADRECRIMVTMPSEAADNYQLIHNLVSQGMNCMRINCAHDDATVWARMIDHLRQAERELDRSCKVLMDLAGPKLRTGDLEPGPSVLKVKPQRNQAGKVTVPARIWLTSEPTDGPSAADGQLTVSARWLKRLEIGDRITFTDARGSDRKLTVIDVTPEGCWVRLKKTAYFSNRTRVYRKKKAGKVKQIPTQESPIWLWEGDTLILNRQDKPGRPARLDHQGNTVRSARIGCRLPEALTNVQIGHRIWFDDGKIEGIVQSQDDRQLRILITRAKPNGSKLRADKGINLPDTDIPLSAPTPDDVRDLAFVVQHADLIGMSFVNAADDIDTLCEQIRQLGDRQPAIVLKIETQAGFAQLPNLLLSLMQWPVGGIMLARGDLAVECGFERLAEVQEELMWLCQAAHMPVIWATQVLEGMAKTGVPSRAEITDAAMGHRAECVMLNKGPYIVRTVEVLADILRRMQAHQDKKNDLLRELQVAHSLAMPEKSK